MKLLPQSHELREESFTLCAEERSNCVVYIVGFGSTEQNGVNGPSDRT